MRYEEEYEEGGYVKNGDVREWVWKDAPKDEPSTEEKKTSKAKKEARQG
jgi:hypothetical protein